MKVGFAGAGNMAAAMARGWAAGDGGPEAMLFCDAGSGRAAALADEVGGEARAELSELAGDSDLRGARGQAGRARCRRPKPSAGATPAVISVLGATPIARLRRGLPGAPRVPRDAEPARSRCAGG